MPFLCRLTFVTAFSFLAIAGADNKIGNGGDIVKCGSKLQLLDFYEAELTSKPSKAKASEIAQEMLEKLREFDSTLGSQYLRRLKEIESEIDFKREIELVDVKDSSHLFVPKNKKCKVEQIAVRKVLTSKDEKRFIIRDDYWKKLSSTNQAGLLTHEIIYEHFMKLGEKDSVKARKINALLYSKDVSAKSFWSTIKGLELPIYPQ